MSSAADSLLASRRELFEHIEAFYNTRRLHSALGYLSPAEFDRLTLPAREAA